jgi:hypothetical protein
MSEHKVAWTDEHTGQLKAKLAKLKRDLLTPSGGGGGGGGTLRTIIVRHQQPLHCPCKCLCASIFNYRLFLKLQRLNTNSGLDSWFRCRENRRR